MVLGPQGPGRVGRRRFLLQRTSRPEGRLDSLWAFGMGLVSDPKASAGMQVRLGESVFGGAGCRAAACGRRVGGGNAVHRRRCAAMAIAAGQRAEADLLARGSLAGAPAAMRPAPGDPQPLPVRMRAVARGLLVDLPVDVAVVLDDQKRAGCGKQRPGAARKSGLDGGSEHAFDCRGKLGRNVGSTCPGSRLARNIRIAKPFWGAPACNGDCRALCSPGRLAPVRQVVGGASRNGLVR